MFGNRLSSLRKERSLTQEELGKAIGLGKTTISNYETGYSTPDVDTILNLAKYFGVSTDFLLGRDPIQAKLNVDPQRVGNMADVERLAEEAMESLNQALGEGIVTEEEAKLSLKLFRQSLLIMMEEKKRYKANMQAESGPEEIPD